MRSPAFPSTDVSFVRLLLLRLLFYEVHSGSVIREITNLVIIARTTVGLFQMDAAMQKHVAAQEIIFRLPIHLHKFRHNIV